MNEEIDLSFINMVILQGILFCKYKNTALLTLAMAREMVQARLQLLNGRSLPVCIRNYHGVLDFEPEARIYLNSPEAMAGISAAAVVVEEFHTEMLSTKFCDLPSQIAPTYPCKSLEQAIKWLHPYTNY
jgi:hypothetical protein